MKEAVQPQELDPRSRTENFAEVVSLYTEEEAVREAGRCLQCKNATCIDGCPVNINIKKFIYEITQKDYKAAYFTIREKNDFASICGRVCPAEYQCRRTCVLTKKDQPVAAEHSIQIGFLERFAGDYGMKHQLQVPVHYNNKLTRFKVAVVGSGPAGICTAGELARHGVTVDIFEGLHKSGGVLRYGIPPFRLPAAVLDYEVNYLQKLGVNIFLNCVVGRAKSLQELLREGYCAVFLGLGAGTPSFLSVAGENLNNVYSANEFLTRVNLMGAYQFPEFHTPVNIGRKVYVIGGGNTAMDAARVALRLQKINGIAPNVTVFYRRTEVEMPARRIEIDHAREEGITFQFLVQPTAFGGDEKGFVRRIKALRCELGEPDSSGRRRPVPIAQSDFESDCDMAIIAVGLQANRVLTNVTPDLKLDKWGDIIVDKETMETSIPAVYAGGDIVGGEGTVIEAMGMAKRAAASIIKKLLDSSA